MIKTKIFSLLLFIFFLINPSIAKEPLITEIKPVAALVEVPDSVGVNVKVSPTEYFVPASSTITSLTEPPTIPSTSIIAFSFPTA